MTREEAIHIVKTTKDWSELREALAVLVPELEESQDETTRKELINYILYKVGPHISKEQEHRWIDYLERQKDLYSPLDWNDYKDKPIEIWNAYIRGKAVGIEIEKQKEQKPAEWSEEDEKKLNDVIQHLKVAYSPCDWLNETIDWLKSRRSQSKQEWSEEDKKMLSSIIMFLAAFMGNEEKIDFLKSLRPQSQGVYKQTVEKIRAAIDRYEHNGVFTYERLFDLLGNIKADVHIADECAEILDEPHWKPSEEQMEALDTAIKTFEQNDFYAGALVSLLFDLKKLM